MNNHWSNETTMVQYIDRIFVPYVQKIRLQLQLHSHHPALAIFDVFKGQCVESLFKKLEENHILYIIVAANCTDRMQPLDLSVNKPAKDYMRWSIESVDFEQIICSLSALLEAMLVLQCEGLQLRRWRY